MTERQLCRESLAENFVDSASKPLACNLLFATVVWEPSLHAVKPAAPESKDAHRQYLQRQKSKRDQNAPEL